MQTFSQAKRTKLTKKEQSKKTETTKDPFIDYLEKTSKSTPPKGRYQHPTVLQKHYSFFISSPSGTNSIIMLIMCKNSDSFKP